MVISNIIDNFHKGLFLPSYIRTLQAVFGEKNVYLISVGSDFKNLKISTFIAIATNGPVNMRDFDAWVKEKLGPEAKSVLLSDDLMEKFLARPRSIVITDEYAPVDNLIAPVFEERFGYNRKK